MTLGARYKRLSTLQSRTDRESWKAQDLLWGRSVFVKRGPRHEIVDECLTLLSIPETITPHPTDLLIEPNGEEACFILDWLEGETLAEHLARNGPSDDADILLQVTQALELLHARGFVHVDLKPGNIFLVRENTGSTGKPGAGRPTVLLIDFGMAKTPFFRSTHNRIGGSPPYLAPEVERGWAIDSAADVHALGKILDIGFRPWLERTGRATWVRELFEKPAQQRPKLAEVRAAIEDSVSAEEVSEPPVYFGAGRLLEREWQLGALASLLERDSHSAQLLMQARPGTGMTRLLLEFLVFMEQREKRVPRIIDFGKGPPWNVDVASQVLRHANDQGLPFIASIADPSPGLHGLDAERRAWLQRSARDRFFLEPVVPEAFVASAVDTFGHGGPEIEDLGRALWSEAEGDWRTAARILPLLRQASRATRESAGGSPNEREGYLPVTPSTDLPEDPALLEALCVCALIGHRFTQQIAGTVLSGPSDASQGCTPLDTLVDYGFLREKDRKLEFQTRRLHKDALETTASWESEAVRSLQERVLELEQPEPSDLDASVVALKRARDLGAVDRERELFEGAWIWATNAHQWSHILLLLRQITSDPQTWTGEIALSTIAQLSSRYGMNEGRVRLGVADAVKQSRPDLAIAIWEDTAEGEDGNAAVESISRILNMKPDPSIFEEYVPRLDEWERRGHSLDAGVLDLWRACLALRLGHVREGHALASQAVESMESSGASYRDLGYLNLAILSLGLDDDAVPHLLEEAAEAAPSSPRRMGVCYNAALIHANRCEISAMLQACESGLSLDLGEGTRRIRHLLRQQEAWALLYADRIPTTVERARSLERYATDRGQPEVIRAVLGFCAHYNGDLAGALEEVSEAFHTALQQAHPDSIDAILGILLDIFIDGDRPDFAASLEVPSLGGTSDRPSTVRLQALRTLATGGVQQSWDFLQQVSSETRDSWQVLDRSSLLYQIGWTGLRLVEFAEGTEHREILGQAEAAFARAGATLPRDGFGYYRCRAQVGRGEAMLRLGSYEEGLQTLEGAIEESRDLECQASVRLGLLARLRLEPVLRKHIEGDTTEGGAQ